MSGGGGGAMPTGADGNPGVFPYTGQSSPSIHRDVTRVSVDPSVRAIRRGAFRDRIRLVEVELCEGLEWIDWDAFYGCSSLKRIEIPKTVESIGYGAFGHCRELEEARLREGLRSVKSRAFYQCSSLRKIELPSTVASVGGRAFQDCRQLGEVKLGEGLESIGELAFKCCQSLTRIEIPRGVKVIDQMAFEECLLLESVELSEGLERIDAKAFFNCPSLRHVKIPSTVTVIGEEAFSECRQLEVAELREGLEEIGQNAFSRCQSLKKIRIPSTVRAIGTQAFNYCHRLERAEICDGVERIDKSAFCGCSSLRRVEIPSSVRVVGKWAFFGCERLEEAELRDGVERIEASAFSGCKSLRCVRIPSSVGLVGKSAFCYCSRLVSVEFGGEATNIDKSAFQCCSTLRNIIIPPESEGLCYFSRCHDLLKLFASQEKANEALRRRFDGRPMHDICYFQSQRCSEVELEMFGDLSNLLHLLPNPVEAIPDDSNGAESDQDCLGMTPLHILTCSTKQSLQIYQYIVTTQPGSLITEDRWHCLPITYAILLDVPQDIAQFLIARQKALFPDFIVDWNMQLRNLSRANASLDAVLTMLRMQQTCFPGQIFDWHNAARELTIHCLVRCGSFQDFVPTWTAMIEALSVSGLNHDLIQNLLGIQHRLFPSDNDIKWRVVCEEFTKPMDGWWRRMNPPKPLEIFLYMIQCNLPSRINTMGIKKWRMDIDKSVQGLRSMGSYDRFDAIHCKLVTYEQEFPLLKEATLLLELALWKSKLDESSPDMISDYGQNAIIRGHCRINCGAGVIIPNVLAYIIGD